MVDGQSESHLGWLGASQMIFGHQDRLRTHMVLGGWVFVCSTPRFGWVVMIGPLYVTLGSLLDQIKCGHPQGALTGK